MSKVIAIVPKGLGIGFSLAGIHIMEVSNRDEALDVLALEMDNGDNGIILVDESYTDDLPKELRKKVDKSVIPFVVSIPIITRWEYQHERGEIIENMIRHAIGYRIKIS